MSKYVVVLCFNFCIFCNAESRVCQNRGNERALKLRNGTRTIIILIVVWGIILLRGMIREYPNRF